MSLTHLLEASAAIGVVMWLVLWLIFRGDI